MSEWRHSFFRHIAQTSTSPDGLEVSRGEGIYLYDDSGKAFIDCISGITVTSLGHHHPRIIKAIERQAGIHLHTHVYGEHIIHSQVALAEKLSLLLPTSLSVSYFVNSGAEAVEGALKLARRYTRRFEIVACRNAYHGSTAGAESLRSDLHYTAASRPLVPGIRHIDFNRKDDLEKINHHTAAVIIEPIQGEAGVVVPDAGYLQLVRERCNETGALLILDEIQTGMGRTGTFWAFEQDNAIPDILLLAKAFGGGLPLGAFISSSEIMDRLSHDPPLGHLTTFGGNPLCCATSLEALNIIEDDGLITNAIRQGKHLTNAIASHALVKEVRGRGLMLAVELKEKEMLTKAIHNCKNEGLLVDFFLFSENSIRLYPPLIISDEDSVVISEKMLKALDQL